MNEPGCVPTKLFFFFAIEVVDQIETVVQWIIVSQTLESIYQVPIFILRETEENSKNGLDICHALLRRPSPQLSLSEQVTEAEKSVQTWSLALGMYSAISLPYIKIYCLPYKDFHLCKLQQLQHFQLNRGQTEIIVIRG